MSAADPNATMPLRSIERALSIAAEELTTAESIAEMLGLGHLPGPAEIALLLMTLKSARRQIGRAQNARVAAERNTTRAAELEIQ